MSNIETFKRYLSHKNIKAFGRVIRHGETTQTDDAYRWLFGSSVKNPRLFDDFSDHPRVRTYEKYDGQFIKNGKIDYTTAAGAYQITETTWNGLCKNYGFKTFFPEDQDTAMVALLYEQKALADVLEGRLLEAINKLGDIWASFPSSTVSQPTKPYEAYKKVFLEYGGELAGEKPFLDTVPVPPPAPVSEEPKTNPAFTSPEYYPFPDVQPEQTTQETPSSSPAVESKGEEMSLLPIPGPAGFLWGLASTLINVFEPLAKEKIIEKVNKHSKNPEVAEQVAGAVIDAAKKATGIADPVDAVSTAKKVPEAVQVAQRDALAVLEKLAPILEKVELWDRQAFEDTEKSRAAAAARAVQEGDGEDWFLTRSIVWMFITAIFLLSVLAGVLKYLGMNVETIIGALLTLIGVMSREFSTRYQYRYGSSRGSASKDIVLAEVTRAGKHEARS